MADKPNRSNRPINGQIPKHIEEALAARDYATSYEHLSSKDDYRALEEKLSKLEGQRGTGNQDIIENIGYAEQDLANLDKAYHDRQNEHLANTIATYTRRRNINERTTSMSGKQRFFTSARSSDERYLPTEIIESNIQRGMEQVNALGMEIAGRTRGLGTEEMPDSLRQKTGQISVIEEEIAFNKRLLKVQNKAGLSTEKLFGGVEDVMGRTERYFEGEGIKSKVARGDVGSIGDETKALGMRQRDLFMAQGQYDRAMGGGAGTDELKEFVKALKNATGALSTQQKVVEEMNRQGAGGGGMGWGDVGMVASLAGRATAFAVRSTRQMVVDNDIKEMGMKAKYASMANRIYSQAGSAIMGGSMDAMLELTGGSLGFAASEANFNKGFTNIAEGAAQLGDAAEGVGNTITAGIGGGKAGFAHGAAIAAGSQATIELSKAAVKADMLRRGLFGGKKGIESYNTALGLSKQMRMMDSKMFQAVYDQGMTAYNSVTGLGNAGGIRSQLMDTDVLGRMAGVGLTPEKAAQLTAGMRAAGAMSSTDAMRVIEGAGAAKQRGILGQSEYVSMASQLMGAGGGAGDLESIMAAAVSAGMDNSKSIGELVSGTLALSSGMAGIGVSGIGATQSLLARATQNLVAAGVDPNLAVGAAGQSLQNYSNLQASKQFTLGNIMERSGLRGINNNFNNANVAQMDQLQQMTAAEHKVLLQGARAVGESPADIKARSAADQLLKSKGLTEILNPNGAGINEDAVQRMAALSAGGVLIDQGALGQRGINVGAIVKKASSGQELTDKETAILANAGVRAETFLAANQLNDPSTKDPNSKAILVGAKVGQTQAEFELDKVRTIEKRGGASQEDIFKSLEVTLAGIQENVNPEKMSEEVQKAAESFTAPTLTFKEATGDFKKAVKMFVDNQNTMMNRIGENKTKPGYDILKTNNNTSDMMFHPKEKL